MAHLLSNHDMAKLVRAAGWRGPGRPSPGRLRTWPIPMARRWRRIALHVTA